MLLFHACLSLTAVLGKRVYIYLQLQKEKNDTRIDTLYAQN